MGQLQPFIQPFTLKCNNRKGGGEDCGEMGLCACASGMRMKSKGIPKYQREEVRQSGPTPLGPIRTLFFTQHAVGQYTLHKGSKHPFDQYMHFHNSALFYLYSQASGYKEIVIHPTVRRNRTLMLHLLTVMLFLLFFNILCVIAFRQMIYRC